MLRLISRVFRPQWRNSGIVNVPLTGPPPPTVKPGPELRLTLNGVVWQLLPTGRLRPPTTSFVILRVTLAVLVMVFALRSTVPEAGPFWIISVVALTGTRPSTLVDAVAGGRVSVDVDVPVVRSTAAARV